MVDTFQLPNGLTGVCESRPGTGTVTMQVVIKSGSMHEKADEGGLTYLTQEAVNGGTKTRSREDISHEIESRGANLFTVTERTTTTFGSTALARDAEDIFEILADVVRNPAYDADEVAKTKQQIEHWVTQKFQDPGRKAQKKFFEAAFSGQAIANDPMGDPDVVESFTLAQIQKKHEELLAHPENIVISFAGDITTEQAEKLVTQYFDDLKAATPAAAPQITFEGNDLREANSNEQMNIMFGFEAPSMKSPERYDLLMLNELLSGGMSSPLFQEIREKRGLVYSVSAGYAPYETKGMFYVVAGTGKGNAGELIDTTFNLLGDTITNGFTDEEIDGARERLLRSIKTGLESSSRAADRNANLILNHGRIVPLEEMEKNLKNVTNEDIRRACAKLLEGGNYALSGVGPQDTMPTEAEIKAKMQDTLDTASVPSARAAAKTIVTYSAAPAGAQNNAAANQNIQSGDPKTTVLPNGMIVVTTERPGSLSAGAWVGAGSDHETPELNGATHMNEHMMFKGTPSYGPGTIDKIIEGELGGGLNAYTSNDCTAYYFYSLTEDQLDKVIDICGEMVFEANISEDEFDGKMVTAEDGSQVKAPGERDVVIEEIKRANDNLMRRLLYVFNDVAYPNQPHGKPVLGTEETLTNMTAKMLRDYRDEYYSANNVVFSAAGPIKHEDFVALIEKKFGQMPTVPFDELPTPTYEGGTKAIEMDSAQMASIIIGAEGVANTEDDSFVYDALAEIIGGGTSSRLHKEVVDKRGLTGQIGAGSLDYRNCGQFIIHTHVAPENIKETLGVIYDQLHDLRSSITQEELDKAKANMEMGTLREIETNRGACDAQGNYTLQSGEAQSVSDITGKIRQISLGDLQRVIDDILASNPTVGMVVPTGTDEALIPDHDEVLELKDGSSASGNGLRAPRPAQ